MAAAAEQQLAVAKQIKELAAVPSNRGTIAGDCDMLARVGQFLHSEHELLVYTALQILSYLSNEHGDAVRAQPGVQEKVRALMSAGSARNKRLALSTLENLTADVDVDDGDDDDGGG
eukprot:CAMPEP_0198323670 /NCGR_PEP_ID=MMETSP1450-20131203/11850_1 /TAXON_ID=753684 ORGANISM="Madagascaria erythrocladiodes, Strain CCMP3234" /NCGR_SAMPLE_ID=MMETSP1450 /ASSEMBLY_ACC=CAM_ASM_001115 /LENGTH=116 /DNA_ID=CAMNT_0044027397 /DNA_START=74 /DNA_END=420 /DNA_ORIENTATION=-